MIFEGKEVTVLVVEWQRTHDAVLLENILAKSQKLIEVIVSSYDPNYRDDLIQESYARLQYAIPFFNPNISTLHNYFTTVIRNRCATYLRKQGREPQIDIDLQLTGDRDSYPVDDEELLHNLVAHNRKRFPSMSCEDIDGISEFVYFSLIDNTSRRGVVVRLMEMFNVSRTVATVIYHSSIIHLRSNYILVDCDENCPQEFSLLIDLREKIGNELFDEISTLFSGMYVKFQ